MNVNAKMISRCLAFAISFFLVLSAAAEQDRRYTNVKLLKIFGAKSK